MCALEREMCYRNSLVNCYILPGFVPGQMRVGEARTQTQAGSMSQEEGAVRRCGL